MQKFVLVLLVGVALTLVGCTGVVYTPYPSNVAYVDDGPDVIVTRYYNPTTLVYYDYYVPGSVVVYGHWHYVNGCRTWKHRPDYVPNRAHRLAHGPRHAPHRTAQTRSLGARTRAQANASDGRRQGDQTRVRNSGMSSHKSRGQISNSRGNGRQSTRSANTGRSGRPQSAETKRTSRPNRNKRT